VSVLVFPGGEARHALEELGEERRVGEVHLVADGGDGLVGVHQVNLDAGDQGVVDPLLATLAAHLLDDGAQVAWREAQPGGIESPNSRTASST